MKAVLSSRKGVVMLSYSRGPYDVIGLGPSRPLHKWPPVKSAPGWRG